MFCTKTLGRRYCDKCNKSRRNLTNWSKDRKLVLERDKNKCQICSSKTNLVVHHLDGNGNHSKSSNSSLENLIVLCKLCHLLLHSFIKLSKNKNKEELLEKMLKLSCYQQ